MARTTSLSVVLASRTAPVAYFGTLSDDGLFHRIGTRTVVDLDGDPGLWSVFTQDHAVRLAKDDAAGFRMFRGAMSAAKLFGGTHAWKTERTLEAFLGSEHVLLSNLRGVTLDAIRKAYAAFRTIDEEEAQTA